MRVRIAEQRMEIPFCKDFKILNLVQFAMGVSTHNATSP